MKSPELQAICERADKATEGPWMQEGDCENCGGSHIVEERLATEHGEYGEVLSDWHPIIMGCDGNEFDDLELMAHARTDIPALLDYIDRQKKLSRTLAEALEPFVQVSEAMAKVKWAIAERLPCDEFNRAVAALKEYEGFE